VAGIHDIVNERWTFLILRDPLRLSPRKFQDLEASLAGIGPNTLSARLSRPQRQLMADAFVFAAIFVIALALITPSPGMTQCLIIE
jgi:DNA-binding HxlR family transcriptional regulator